MADGRRLNQQPLYGVGQLTRQPKQAAGSSGREEIRAGDLFLLPLAGAQAMLDAWLGWFGDHRKPPFDDEAALPWTMPHRVTLELTTLRLRDFSAQKAGRPVLICAPYALHSALITDFAPAHSIVQALQQGGVSRVHVTDWRSATPQMRSLSIDSYLADLNVAIDEIGPPVDLVGLCQGGWLSLVYAARFPEKVRRLVLVGAPVDVSCQSPLSQMAATLPHAAFAGLVNATTGLVSGLQLRSVWSAALNAPDEAVRQSFADANDGGHLLARFQRWNDATLDLPGVYYVEVADRVFRENRIAKGGFVALGRRIDLRRFTLPVFLLVGTEDRVVPAEQALATAGLLGTPAAQVEIAVEPCGHLGLFMGEAALNRGWRRIAAWLCADEPSRSLDQAPPRDFAAVAASSRT